MFLADCPSFRARLTVAGCLANQASPNDNTRAICQRCQAKIAGDQVPAPSMTVSQRQSERAKMVRNRHGSSSAPVEPIFKYAAVAQTVERPPCKRVVGGSKPSGGSNITPSPAGKVGSLPSDTQRPGSVSARKGAERGGRDLQKGRATGKDAPQPLQMAPDKVKECKAIAKRLAKKYESRPQPIVESGWVKASVEAATNPPSKMGRPPKCKCAACKVPNCGGRPKGMTRQGEKRRGWPLGVKRGPRRVAA